MYVVITTLRQIRHPGNVPEGAKSPAHSDAGGTAFVAGQSRRLVSDLWSTTISGLPELSDETCQVSTSEGYFVVGM